MAAHDYDYYARRERQERLHAARSADHGARRIHLELAEHYAAMLRERMPVQLSLRA